MTEREILDRIIGTANSISDVIDAFSASHPDIAAYRWTATAEVRGEVIRIAGFILEHDHELGYFSRRLFYERGVGRAIHEIMEIERPHRDKDIAKYHYSRALRFYDRVGIRYVSMDAEGEGTVIWPTFGFDLIRTQHREMLLRILRDWGAHPLPARTSVLAPQVVDISVEGYPTIGAKAIKELARRAGGHLPMALDLTNDVQRAYLRNRGIL